MSIVVESSLPERSSKPPGWLTLVTSAFHAWPLTVAVSGELLEPEFGLVECLQAEIPIVAITKRDARNKDEVFMLIARVFMARLVSGIKAQKAHASG